MIRLPLPIFQSSVDVGILQIRIVVEDVLPALAGSQQAEHVGDANLIPRMQGRPPQTSGSNVMRSRFSDIVRVPVAGKLTGKPAELKDEGLLPFNPTIP